MQIFSLKERNECHPAEENHYIGNDRRDPGDKKI